MRFAAHALVAYSFVAAPVIGQQSVADRLQRADALIAANRDRDALRQLSQALRQAKRSGDLSQQIECQRRVGGVFHRRNDPRKALRAWREVKELLKVLVARDSRPRPRGLREAWQKVLELEQRIDPTDRTELVAGLSNVGLSLDALGRETEALPKHEAALAMCHRLYEGDHRDVVICMHNVAGCLHRLGKSAAALAKHRAGVAMCRRLYQGDHALIAGGLNHVALCLCALGRSAEALPIYEAALAMRKRLNAGDHWRVASSLTNVGLCLDRLGKSAEALPRHRAALDMFRRLHGREHPRVAVSLTNVAFCLDALGREEEALPMYRDALSMWTRLHEGDHPQVARGLNNLGAALAALGRNTDALPKYAAALLMNERLYKGDHPHVAMSLSNEAVCLRRMGRNAEALPKHEAALAMTRRLYEGDHPSVATNLGNVANCRKDLGKSAEALREYRAALAMYRRLHDGDHPDIALGLNNLASGLDRLGEKAAALAKYQSALAMRQSLHEGDHPGTASALSSVGTCLHELGHSGEALPKLQAALAMRKRLYRHDHPDLAMTLNNVAHCLAALGKYEGAVTTQAAALAMYERVHGRAHPTVASNLTSLARLWLRRGDRRAEAIQHLERAIEILEDHRRSHRSLEGRDLADYFATLKEPGAYGLLRRALVRSGNAAAALDCHERSRARGLLDTLHRSHLKPLDEVERLARARGDAEESRRIARLRDELRMAEIEEERALFMMRKLASERRLERAEIESRLEQTRNELRAAQVRRRNAMRERSRTIREVLPIAEPATAVQVRALLGEGELLLVYALGTSESHLFLVPPAPSRVEAVPLPAKAASLASNLGRWLAAVSRSSLQSTARGRSLDKKRTAPSIDAKNGRRLARTLVPDAAWRRLSKARRVVLIPDGPLHRLPFETLVVGTNKRGEPRYWLDDGPAITYAPSGSVLRHVLTRAAERTRDTTKHDIVAVGDPVFEIKDVRKRFPLRGMLLRDPGGGGALARLPGTATEVTEIGVAFGGAKVAANPRIKVLLREDATEKNVFALAGQARFLHLATHGLADEVENASYSALILTPPKKPVRGDDGLLELRDLLNHWGGRLTSCRMVVLSACQTHVGPQQLDEAVHALPIGFLYAGAASVVASFWKVQDDSTARLMADFYRRLAQGGQQDRLAAFTEARRALKTKYPHPFHWAPFVHIGSPR